MALGALQADFQFTRSENFAYSRISPGGNECQDLKELDSNSQVIRGLQTIALSFVRERLQYLLQKSPAVAQLRGSSSG